jgi:hypothetical protein
MFTVGRRHVHRLVEPAAVQRAGQSWVPSDSSSHGAPIGSPVSFWVKTKSSLIAGA